MPRPRMFNETDVVTAVQDVFWAKGYAATSIDDLCSATGLGRGSLYGAFGDKHAMYLRALDGYCASALDQIRAELRGPKGTALDRVVNHIRKSVRTHVADTMRFGCLMANSASELSAADRDVVRRSKRVLDGWRRELAATLAQAQCDGELAADADPEALASLLLTVLRGMEAIRKQGSSAAAVTAAGEQAIALLPRATAT